MYLKEINWIRRNGNRALGKRQGQGLKITLHGRDHGRRSTDQPLNPFPRRGLQIWQSLLDHATRNESNSPVPIFPFWYLFEINKRLIDGCMNCLLPCQEQNKRKIEPHVPVEWLQVPP